jgi:hypothetical protein
MDGQDLKKNWPIHSEVIYWSEAYVPRYPLKYFIQFLNNKTKVQSVGSFHISPQVHIQSNNYELKQRRCRIAWFLNGQEPQCCELQHSYRWIVQERGIEKADEMLDSMISKGHESDFILFPSILPLLSI